MYGVIHELHWNSDWNGDEVGYPHVNVVGLYTSLELDCDMYIDTETHKILEILKDNE